MKLKSSVLVIIISTFVLIGLLNFIINKTNNGSSDAVQVVKPKENDVFSEVVNDEKPSVIKKDAAVKKDEVKPEQEKVMGDEIMDIAEADDEDDEELSADDIKKISGVANLSDAELTKELAALKLRIEDEHLFDKFEDGDFVGAKAEEVREILERFALLGLEEHRRKFMGIEPELKNPLFAHKESLKEIRELLDDEEE